MTTVDIELPRNADIERLVLGALLLSESPQRVLEVRAKLPDDAFMSQSREIYQTLGAMAEASDSINPVVLMTRLAERRSNVEPATIAALTDDAPIRADLTTEIGILRDLATRRAIVCGANHWLMEAQGRDVNVGALIERIKSTAADLGAMSPASAARVSFSWADLCEMKFPPRETLLHEIERGEVVMCASITNRGKTTFWRNAGVSLACGRGFAPLVKSETPRVVYYLDFETRLPRARADITTMLSKLSVSERALVGRNFHLVADCRIDNLPLSLSNPKHFAIIETDARRVGADVVIVDTITAGFDLDNENDNAECTRVMKRLIHLAQRLNAVVIFLHHIGKAKQEEGQTPHNVHRSRGGSAFSGASTAIVNLLPDPKADDVITVECAKVKGEKFEDRLLKLDKAARWFKGAGAGADDEAAPVPLYDQNYRYFQRPCSESGRRDSSVSQTLRRHD
jgi:AAA domain/DnaB-like helicase N terminal domain